jgi:hypothetical protein
MTVNLEEAALRLIDGIMATLTELRSEIQKEDSQRRP